MEELIVFLVIGWILKAITKKSKNAKQAKPTNNKSFNAAQRAERARLAYEKSKAKPASAPAQPKPAPVQMSMLSDTLQEGEGRPTLERTQPFRGSLEVQSTEGEDLCDPTLGHKRETAFEEGNVYENQIGDAPRLEWTPQAIWQGVVMSEVLSRPGGRRAAR